MFLSNWVTATVLLKKELSFILQKSFILVFPEQPNMHIQLQRESQKHGLRPTQSMLETLIPHCKSETPPDSCLLPVWPLGLYRGRSATPKHSVDHTHLRTQCLLSQRKPSHPFQWKVGLTKGWTTDTV